MCQFTLPFRVTAHLEVSDFQAQEPQHVGGLLQKGEVQCLDFFLMLKN